MEEEIQERILKMGPKNIIYGSMLFLCSSVSLGNAEIVEKYGRKFEKWKEGNRDAYTEIGPSYSAIVETRKGNVLFVEDVCFFKEIWTLLYGRGLYRIENFYCKSIDVYINEIKETIPFSEIEKLVFFWNKNITDSDSATIYLKNKKNVKVDRIGLFWQRGERDFDVRGKTYNDILEKWSNIELEDTDIKSIEFK